MENRLRRFFGTDFFPDFYEEPFAWTPVTDLVHLENEWLLTVELPGMKLEDFDIDVVDDVLTLKGEKKRFSDVTEENYKVSERTYGMFERVFTLPRIIDAENIKADYDAGVLTVHLPLTAETKGRRIPIEST